MREDQAEAHVKAGDVCLWDGTRLVTSLQFLYAREREEEPVIAALAGIVRDVWPAAAAR
jgi:hypothetical protein